MARPRVVNIGPRGQRRRLGLGVLMLALGAGLVSLGPRPAWWALLALPLFFLGLLGILQAREGTWVRLAARGTRDMDGGVTEVPSPEDARVLRAQAARIYAVSITGALLLTGLGLLLVGM